MTAGVLEFADQNMISVSRLASGTRCDYCVASKRNILVECECAGLHLRQSRRGCWPAMVWRSSGSCISVLRPLTGEGTGSRLSRSLGSRIPPNGFGGMIGDLEIYPTNE
jgi:hypothetical protein